MGLPNGHVNASWNYGNVQKTLEHSSDGHDAIYIEVECGIYDNEGIVIGVNRIDELINDLLILKEEWALNNERL